MEDAYESEIGEFTEDDKGFLLKTIESARSEVVYLWHLMDKR